MKKILFLLALGFIGITSATVTGTLLNPSDANPDQVVGNKASMVQNNTMVNNHYVLNVLSGRAEGEDFVRVAAVSLDNLPVMVAVSKTSLKNKDFVRILNNTKVRLGIQIMALSPTITYNDQSSGPVYVNVGDIDNPVAKKYLKSIGYPDNKKLVKRSITIAKGDQKINTTEYICPNDVDY